MLVMAECQAQAIKCQMNGCPHCEPPFDESDEILTDH
jgi:hypothetical protein